MVFFSCCSVKLNEIVDYINLHKTLPIFVDSSKQFDFYKKNTNADITYNYFDHYDNINILPNSHIINYNHTDQFTNYSKLDYTNIIPIVKKYFSISIQINNIIENIENKYNLDYNVIL